ncbi:MAG: beta-glucosidase, partial [Povalibacter sp.]
MSRPAATVRLSFAVAQSFLGFFLVTSSRAQDARDPQIEALISKMTLEEKAGQLTILADETRNVAEGVNPDFKKRQADALYKEVRSGRIGALFNGHGV